MALLVKVLASKPYGLSLMHAWTTHKKPNAGVLLCSPGTLKLDVKGRWNHLEVCQPADLKRAAPQQKQKKPCLHKAGGDRRVEPPHVCHDMCTATFTQESANVSLGSHVK